MEKDIFSRDYKSWNYSSENGWIGGKEKFSNLSGGYHGILKQWWETFNVNNNINVLLISECSNVKKEFLKKYPNWNIEITDYYPELIKNDSNDIDIIADVCKDICPFEKEKYDLIINQATLEHLYNPFQAMKNFSIALKKDGLLISHTHPPKFPYHGFPRDYIRFQRDWWYDLPKYINTLILEELYNYNDFFIFTCYKKI